jgi:hypothetical protein
MAIHINQVMLQPIIALIAGILILVVPRILNYIVAIYLIIVGVLGLWPHLLRRMDRRQVRHTARRRIEAHFASCGPTNAAFD